VSAVVVVDEEGRLALPEVVKEKLGLRPGSLLAVLLKGKVLILKPVDKGLEERVARLAEFLEHEAPKPFVREVDARGSKWLSEEYCLRKLGL